MSFCVQTIFQISWSYKIGTSALKVSSYAPIVHTTAKQIKKTFHVVEITKTSVKHPKMKNAHAKRAKLSFLVVKYANL